MKKIVIVSGGFDPLHSGHLEYFKYAKKLGDKLVVGINSDQWLLDKKGKNFLPFEERLALVEAIKDVDEAIAFNDEDGSAVNLIKIVSCKYNNDMIIFANGGDRSSGNVPELAYYDDDKRIKFVFGVGGEDKKNSSSDILNSWDSRPVIRPWGTYTNINSGERFRVKELVVAPNSMLSMQRHHYRSEHWVVVEGKIFVNTINHASSDFERDRVLVSGQSCYIKKGDWHQIENPCKTPAKIIETWIGDYLDEDDIVRR